MMIAFVIATMIALAAAAAAGWLLGVRRGRGARDDLATATAAAQARAEDAARVAAAADAQAAEAMAGAAQAREELMRVRAGTIAMREQVAQLSTARDAALDDARAAHSELVTATAEHSAVRAQLARLGTEHAAQRAQIAALRERLASDQATGRAREGRAVAEIERVLAPLAQRERLASHLATLAIGCGNRGELPRMMEAIAQIGQFSTVVLSDEAGLPLAVNHDGGDGTLLAGLWSMLLSLADRVTTAGAPSPLAVMVHDAANQTIVHRLFTAGGTRFLLTAVGHARALSPEILDPALSKLERLLAGSALAS